MLVIGAPRRRLERCAVPGLPAVCSTQTDTMDAKRRPACHEAQTTQRRDGTEDAGSTEDDGIERPGEDKDADDERDCGDTQGLRQSVSTQRRNPEKCGSMQLLVVRSRFPDLEVCGGNRITESVGTERTGCDAEQTKDRGDCNDTTGGDGAIRVDRGGACIHGAPPLARA